MKNYSVLLQGVVSFVFAVFFHSCSTDGPTDSIYKDTSGHYNLTGLSYQSEDGSCLKFVSNTMFKYSDVESLHSGTYTWVQEKLRMDLDFVNPIPYLPGAIVASVQWFQENNKHFIVMNSGMKTKMVPSTCTPTVSSLESEAPEVPAKKNQIIRFESLH